MTTYFDLPDGLVDFELLDEVEITTRKGAGGRRRKRPKRQGSATKKAISLMAERRITNRDYRLLETLYGAAPILSRHQIQRLFWPDSKAKKVETIVSNRLGKLVYPYYALNCNPNTTYVLDTAGMVPCYSYYLDTVGIKLLAAQRYKLGQDFREPMTNYHAMSAPYLLLHDLMVSELFVRFVLRTQDDDDLRLRWVVQWKSIIRDQADDEIKRPDASIIIHQNKYDVTNHYYLELERRDSSSIWRDKVQGYENALTEGRWRGKFGAKQFPTILVVSDGVSTQSIANVVAKHSKATRYLFRSWDSVLTSKDILHGWYNKNGETVSIIQH